MVVKAATSNSSLNHERRLDPDKDADEIIQLGQWQPYRHKIINNGKWKSYYYKGELVSYTFQDAAAIEEHQPSTTERLLAELREMFKPLPPLNEEEKKVNERLYWERIRREIIRNGRDR